MIGRMNRALNSWQYLNDGITLTMFNSLIILALALCHCGNIIIILSLANGLSTFGTLFPKMSISVHCCDLSAVFNMLIFLVLQSVFNSRFYV